MKKYLIILCGLLLVGCNPKTESKSNSTTETNVVESFPVVSTSEGTPSGEDVGVINPENTGYYLDANGDGITDYIKLMGNDLYFQKGLGSTYENPKVILKIEGNIIAYSVREGDGKIRLLYWDNNNKGWYRTVLGVFHGAPYFGNVEGQ